jgi:hypothetical protein
MGKIEGLKKTNSKSPVPKVSPLRDELKKVYAANGKTYNANSHLGKIYEDLKRFNDKSEEDKERNQFEKHMVVRKALYKRNKELGKSGNI